MRLNAERCSWIAFIIMAVLGVMIAPLGMDPSLTATWIYPMYVSIPFYSEVGYTDTYQVILPMDSSHSLFHLRQLEG